MVHRIHMGEQPFVLTLARECFADGLLCVGMTIANERIRDRATADVPIGPWLWWLKQWQADGITLDQVLAQTINGSLMGGGCESWKTLVSVTAYHHLCWRSGGVEHHRDTPPYPSRGHQLSPIAHVPMGNAYRSSIMLSMWRSLRRAKWFSEPAELQLHATREKLPDQDKGHAPGLVGSIPAALFDK
jgi:hypothetical protein